MALNSARFATHRAKMAGLTLYPWKGILEMTAEELLKLAWFRQLISEIEHRLEASADDTSFEDALRREQEDLQQKLNGWAKALADPNLPDGLRSKIYTDAELADARSAEITDLLRRKDTARNNRSSAVDANVVAERLSRLEDLIDGDNATRTNMELALHVDRIDCGPDGVVKMRLCKLGGMPNMIPLVETSESREAEIADQQTSSERVRSRRRAKLHVHDDSIPQSELRAMLETIADPHRFSGLGDEWFWVDSTEMPKKVSWSAAHAAEVAATKVRLEAEAGAKIPLRQLVDIFGKSRPTITRALEIAESLGFDTGAPFSKSGQNSSANRDT